MANAMVNKWPMICIGGASDSALDCKGAFQEYDTLSCVKPVTKFSAKVTQIKQIPFLVERAVRLSMYGTPGPVYLEFPSEVIHGKIDSSEVSYLPLVEMLPMQM
jgi:2-hydroxyacyl-CoA lyase 1